MSIRVLYFAGLREKLGLAGETVDLPQGVSTLADLRAWLIESGGRKPLGDVRNLRSAVNQEMAVADSPVREGDEVAFFPPVTGG